MIAFANAKINLGLSIVSKRPDGYHNLETIFYPITLCDIVEIVKNDDAKSSLHLSGIPIDGNADENLVVKAYNILKKDFDIPGIDIYLHKIIPFGAGLGGGSSDASFTLKLINEEFALGLGTAQLQSYAAQLGADCPFFLKNQPVFAEGTGNIFSPIDLTLNGYSIVLVKPNISVSTAKAFAGITPQTPAVSLKEIAKMPINRWKEYMQNDFEKSVFAHYPQIEDIKSTLYDSGAVYASMSGSGSSVYGLFSTPVDIENLFPEYFVWQGKCKK